MSDIFFCGHRFPPDIIRLAVKMYVRYPLSLKQVEDLLFERGIDVSYETIRVWESSGECRLM